MNNHGYLKFILTVLVLVIAFFGYMLVTAVDRVRESNLRILEKLEALPGRIQFPAVVPAGGFPGGVAVSPAERRARKSTPSPAPTWAGSLEAWMLRRLEERMRSGPVPSPPATMRHKGGVGRSPTRTEPSLQPSKLPTFRATERSAP